GAELAYCGVVDLCRQVPKAVAALPPSLRETLRGATGLTEPTATSTYTVRLALKTLIEDLARERPVLIVIDDGDWMDGASAETLAFLARQARSTRVALVVTVRAGEASAFDAVDAQGLDLDGLDPASQNALLGSERFGPLDARVRDHIRRCAQGNP